MSYFLCTTRWLHKMNDKLHQPHQLNSPDLRKTAIHLACMTPLLDPYQTLETFTRKYIHIRFEPDNATKKNPYLGSQHLRHRCYYMSCVSVSQLRGRASDLGPAERKTAPLTGRAHGTRDALIESRNLYAKTLIKKCTVNSEGKKRMW